MAKMNPAIIVVGGLIGVLLLFGIIGAVMYKPAYETEPHHADVPAPVPAAQPVQAAQPAAMPAPVQAGSEEEVFIMTYWNMFLAGLGEQPAGTVPATPAEQGQKGLTIVSSDGQVIAVIESGEIVI